LDQASNIKQRKSLGKLRKRHKQGALLRIQIQKAVMTIESDSGVIFSVHAYGVGGNIGAYRTINGIDNQGASQPLPLKLYIDRKPSDPDRRYRRIAG